MALLVVVTLTHTHTPLFGSLLFLFLLLVFPDVTAELLQSLEHLTENGCDVYVLSRLLRRRLIGAHPPQRDAHGAVRHPPHG